MPAVRSVFVLILSFGSAAPDTATTLNLMRTRVFGPKPFGVSAFVGFAAMFHPGK